MHRSATDGLPRLPHIAFQTLASDPLVEQFIDNHDLLDTLFSYLDSKEGNLSRSKSGYFAKITEVLFEKYPTEVLLLLPCSAMA